MWELTEVANCGRRRCLAGDCELGGTCGFGFGFTPRVPTVRGAVRSATGDVMAGNCGLNMIENKAGGSPGRGRI